MNFSDDARAVDFHKGTRVAFRDSATASEVHYGRVKAAGTLKVAVIPDGEEKCICIVPANVAAVDDQQ